MRRRVTSFIGLRSELVWERNNLVGVISARLVTTGVTEDTLRLESTPVDFVPVHWNVRAM